MPDKNGSTKRDSLMQVIQNSEEGTSVYESAIEQLEAAPEIPFYLEHIWQWFWQIHKGRTYGMSGPNPLTWSDIEAWDSMLNIQVRPIEAEIIKEIDSVYLKYTAEHQKKNTKGTK